jgi:hypothetical protein
VVQQLGFENFIAEVEESNKDFKQSQKVRAGALVHDSITDQVMQDRARTQPDTKGMTQEQLLELQEKLFASSQARFEAGQ